MHEFNLRFGVWRAIRVADAGGRLIFEKLFVFFVLTIAPAIWVLISCYHELNFYSFSYLISGFFVNSIIQVIIVGILFGVASPSSRWLVVLLMLSLLLVNLRFNVIYLVSLGFYQKLFFLIAFLLISFVSILGKSGLRFSLLFSFFLLVQPLISLILNSNHNPHKENYEVSSVEFHKEIARRNVYFIGLDSLTGDAYYKKYFSDDAVWSKEFEDLGFRRLNNVHTGGANSTRSFYLNLLSFSNNGDYLRSRNLLSRPLRFYDALKEKGYRSQFMFHSYLLGSGRNTFFDYNYPLNEQGNATCPFLAPNVGFYLCQEKVVRFVEGILQNISSEKYDFSTPVDSSIEKMMPVLLDRVKVAADDKDPWVSIFHLWEPGHTLGEYRHNNEKQRGEFMSIYRQRALNATRDAMSIVAEIKKYDRNPVIIISGDHGPYLSQGWDLDSSIREIFSSDERYEDTQGIGFFIYPKSFCSDKIKDGYVSYFLFKDVLECLSLKRKVD